MDTRIKFLYLSEPDMIKAGVKTWISVWRQWKICWLH